jgi:hypothetical protein
MQAVVCQMSADASRSACAPGVLNRQKRLVDALQIRAAALWHPRRLREILDGCVARRLPRNLQAAHDGRGRGLSNV